MVAATEPDENPSVNIAKCNYKRKSDKAQYGNGEPTCKFFSDRLKHCSPIRRLSIHCIVAAAVNNSDNRNCQLAKLVDKKNAPLGAFAVSGGVDGTRTRDPRRDRPVF